MRTSFLLGFVMASWTNSTDLSSFGQLTADKVQQELEECRSDSILPQNFLGVKTAIGLCVCIPIQVLGIILNAFVLWLMRKQKEYTNQDCYVVVLCVFGFIMSFPVFTYTIFMELFRCYAWPPFINDLWLMLVQLCAGVTIWLVGAISIDRLLMIVYHARYPVYVTKRRVYIKIAIVIIFYFLVSFCVNFSPYLDGSYFKIIDPWKPAAGRPTASFLAPTSLTKALNQLRMVTDRFLPWILCTGVYTAIFAARRHHKKSFHKQSSINSQQEAQAADRVKKGKKLAIGISVSLFVFLLPETVFDVSQYMLHVDLVTGRWEILSVLWYGLNAVNPVVYLVSLPKLRAAAVKVLSGFKKKKLKIGVSETHGTNLAGTSDKRRMSGMITEKLGSFDKPDQRRRSSVNIEVV